MNRAVFLDRDGTLNRNVWNPATGKYESPLTPDQLELIPGVIPSLQRFKNAGFLLILVSNQPNSAKGKNTVQELEDIHQKFVNLLQIHGISLAAVYYCLHHPDFSGPCFCRKPSPYFIFRAADQFKINLCESWMIGDRLSDIECGRAAGTKTILISAETANSKADYVAADLWSASRTMLLGG